QKSTEATGITDLIQLAADINGLMLSFSRYKDLVMANGNDLHKMKSFFEAFVKSLCNGLPSNLVRYTLQSPQQKYKLSVNEILKHSKDFSEAYQCPPGSEMNPSDKCIL
ncbi:unnamed protein product, partial [Schistosoma turkestanicum]